jgi:tRNA1(Val) A37 N6-methylase TrmN6
LLLYDFALGGNLKGDILDIGCGSGVVGLLLARDTGAGLVGIDRQEEMVACSQKSAEANSVEAEFVCVDAADFCHDRKFGVVVSNPPFYPSCGTRSPNDSKNIARYDVYLPFDVLAQKANAQMHNRGSFIFCYDARTLQSVMHTLKERKFFISRLRFVHPDATKEARLMLVEANKYQKGTMQVMPPLLMDDAAYLESVRKKANTVSMV